MKIRNIDVDEVISGLKHCTNSEKDCACSLTCPYGDLSSCSQCMMLHALDLIQGLLELLELTKTPSSCL